MHQLNLISIALPKLFTRQTIETSLGCSLQKGIEKAFFAHEQERYIVFTQFNVITFINYSREAMLEALHKLHLKHAHRYEEFYLYQDYPIRIDANLSVTCKINNDYILIDSGSNGILRIVND